MEKVFKLAIYLLILLGIIHSGLTPVFYKTLNVDALWFFGTGLSYIFMGLYNLAALKVRVNSISRVAVILNFIGTVFTIAITYLLREPQAYVAMVLVLFIFIFSIFAVNGLIKR